MGTERSRLRSRRVWSWDNISYYCGIRANFSACSCNLLLSETVSAYCYRRCPPPSRNDCFNISETTRASTFKINHNVSLDSLYISTRNDVTIYFRSAVHSINVFILGYVRVAISRQNFSRFLTGLQMWKG